MATTSRQVGALCLAICSIAGVADTAIAASPEPSPSAAAAEQLLLSGADFTSDCNRYRKRNWLRQKFVRDADYDRYGLQFGADCNLRHEVDRVVILVHGFNSSPLQNAAMMESIRAAGMVCGSFAYPNDHTVPASAQLLSNELRRFRRRYPNCRVALVCHSMGSLVARACVEDPLYDPGNIEQLIMIAPPTHGTVIAHFAVGSDLWEHWLSRTSGGPWRRMRDSIVDGLGEAAQDLCPNSPFLDELNGRPRSPDVRYSIFLGTDARFSEAQVAWIRESVCDHLAKVPGGNRCTERLDAILRDIDELVEGKGDGVVAVKRGRLDGVSDTVVMPFGHLAVTGEPHCDTLRDVQAAIIERLR